MTHLFKIQLPNSDMFIREIVGDRITYEVREKDTGKLLEHQRTSKFDVGSDQCVHFDNRYIHVSVFARVLQTLAVAPVAFATPTPVSTD